MGELLKQASSPEVLNQAWKKLKKDKAMWSEKVSKPEMEQNLVYHLTKLSNELSSNKYRPAQVRMFPVAKADGKKRIISALTLRDKLAQKAVLSVLNPLGEEIFHHDSFGYRPGRSIDQAMGRVKEYLNCGNIWLVDADIKSFFDNIPHKPLQKCLKKIIPDKELLALLNQWLDIGAPRTGVLGKRRGIPQGGVLSPFLCNVYLTWFDNSLSDQNLPFVRFADDFLVFCPDKKAAEKAREYIRKGLQKLDLELNEKKTRVVKTGPEVIFLGRKLPKSGTSKKNRNQITKKRSQHRK